MESRVRSGFTRLLTIQKLLPSITAPKQPIEGESIATHLRYCSSLTFSIHSTTLPSRRSWMAICVIAVVGVAPCQYFSPADTRQHLPAGVLRSALPSLSPTEARCHDEMLTEGMHMPRVRAHASNVTVAA